MVVNFSGHAGWTTGFVAAAWLLGLCSANTCAQAPAPRAKEALSNSPAKIRFAQVESNQDEEEEEEEEGEGDGVPTLPPTVVSSATADTPPLPPTATAASPEVVTPTTQLIPANQFGGTVRVIQREVIENTPAAQLSDVLRGTAGLDVVRTGPAGSVTSVFLRGANSQHTKVLLNGIPLNEPSGPSRGFDFSTLSLDNVERIEVLQGPQSPLYGSDAVGGVINIVTLRGRDAPGAGGSLMGGSFGTHRESGYARGAGEHHDYAVAGSWFDSDGFSSAARRVGGIERDGLQLGTLDGRFGVWSGGVELEYLFRWIDGRSELDDAPFSLGTPPTDDLFRVIRNQQFFQRAQATWSPGDGLIEHVAAFDLVDYDRDDFDDVFPFSTTGQSRRMLYQVNFQLTDANVLSAGAEYWAEDARAIGFGSDSAASQFQSSAYLQDQWQLGERVYATSGVRWDEHSAAGFAFTYRATLLGDVWETGTQLHGSLGTGFRAPALAENLFPFGNPNLQPERSRGWEYGATQCLTEQLQVGVVYFRNDLENLILFDLNSFLLENIGEAKTHGIEWTAAWQLSPTLLIDGSYTHTDTLDRDTGQLLVRRPRDKGAFAVTWSPQPGSSVRLLGVAVGQRNDTRDGAVRLGNYFFAQLSARHELRENIRCFGRIDNLLDQEYEQATGFASAGISVFTGIEVALR